MAPKSRRSSVVARKLKLLAAVAAAGLSCKTAYAQITINQVSGTDWKVSNGALNIVFNPSGSNITSLMVAGSSQQLLQPGDDQIYDELSKSGLGSGTTTSNYQLSANNYIDLYTTTQSNSTNPFTYQIHYVLFNNSPSIQMYEVVQHSATDIAGSYGQGQFLARVDGTIFNNSYQYNVSVNNQGAQTSVLPNPNTLATVEAQAGRTVSDATSDLNGSGIAGDWGTTIQTKYDYSAYQQQWQGQVEFGSQYQISTVMASPDTLAGGPTKGDLMFTNNIQMVEFLSGHYDGGIDSYVPAQGVATSKLYGPYAYNIGPTNGQTGAELYQNAVNSIPTYQALYPTDTELMSNGYIPNYSRGSLQATISSTAGWSSNTLNNNIVLSDNQKNFQNASTGYEYWGQIAKNGNVTLNNVVAGTYRASIYQLGQWGETRYDNITVNAGQITNPTNLKFVPENFSTAAPIWTIGTPDRSAHEFLNGNNTSTTNGVTPGGDIREYPGAYDYWAEEQALGNPGKVVYYATAVGSTPATNNPNKWIANQWQTFNPGLYDASNGTSDEYSKIAPAYVQAAGGSATYSGSPWEVHFTTTAAQQAQGQYAILSVALADMEASLTVSLNGHSETWHETNASDAAERSGQSGYYQWGAFQFLTSDLLAAGANNVLTFSVSASQGVEYDALRFEITNNSASPSTTGWNDYEYITGANTQAAPADNIGLSATQNVLAQPAELTWNDTGSLNADDVTWDTATQNWNNGTGPAYFAAGSPVTFNDNNAENYFITLNTTVTPGSVLVNNSARDYTISGSGHISGSGSLTKIGTAALYLNTSNSYTGGTNVNGGTLVIGVAGALPSGNVVISPTGTLQFAESIGTTNIQSLSITPGGVGTLDISNNTLLINYAAAGNTSPDASIRAAVVSGANGTSYNGAGIISSTAARLNAALVANGGTPKYGVGYADGSDPYLNNEGPAAGVEEIKLTLLGDLNLDGLVNSADFILFADSFGKTGGASAAWDHGDLNYDGSVNSADFILFADNFGQSLGTVTSADGGLTLAQGGLDAAEVNQFNAIGIDLGIPSTELAALDQKVAAVPEPSAIGLLFAGGISLLPRRRKRLLRKSPMPSAIKSLSRARHA
jgi:autotransporter-associated beta strand protein